MHPRTLKVTCTLALLKSYSNCFTSSSLVRLKKPTRLKRMSSTTENVSKKIKSTESSDNDSSFTYHPDIHPLQNLVETGSASDDDCNDSYHLNDCLRLNNEVLMPIVGFGTYKMKNDLVQPMIKSALGAGYRYVIANTTFLICCYCLNSYNL